MRNNFHFKPISIALVSACLMLITLLVFSHVREYRRTQYQTNHAGTIAGSSSTSLLPQPVQLEGNKDIARFALSIPDGLIMSNDTLKVTYDLHGLCVLAGPSASVQFQQGQVTIVQIPLASAGKNCHAGLQSIDIPFESFIGKISHNAPVEMAIFIWYPTTFSVEIRSIISYNAGSAVLGISLPETSAPIKKSFDHIQPIRPEPYERSDIREY